MSKPACISAPADWPVVLPSALASSYGELEVTAPPCPTESQEGDVLVAYLRVRGIKFHHSPNETGSSPEAKRRAIRMKRQGTSKGFPDYVIALPPFGVLYIELKRQRGSVTSPEQLEWVRVLNQCPGAEAYIAKGAAMAIQYVEGIIGPGGGSDTVQF